MGAPTIQSLQSDIQKLQSQVAALSSTAKNNTNHVNPSARDKTNLSTVNSDQIIDVAWNRYFYYYTPFESLDGWDLVDDSAGLSVVGDGGVTLTTSAVSGHASSIDKAPLNDPTLSFDKDSRFRTTATFTNTASTQTTFAIGDPQAGAGKAYYGFIMQNGVLYGVTGNGTTTSSTKLQTVTAPQIMQLEARLVARNRVDFYASPSATPTASVVLLGSLSTSLPTGNLISKGAFWFFVQVGTTSAAAKQVSINSLEYIQLR